MSTGLADIRLSANWMAACGEPGEDAALYAAVRAVGEEFCPALGIAIPVGKDSLSMKTVWQENGESRSVIAPLSLVVSAFAPVADVRRTLTPLLRLDIVPLHCCWWTWAKAEIAWALRPWRRSTAHRAARRPTWTTPICCGALPWRSRRCGRARCSTPIMIEATVGSR